MAVINFDGVNKVIDVDYDGPNTITSAREIYSRWKDWAIDNSQYEEAFANSVGGNDLGGGVFLDGYFFLRNDLGWRIRAADQDHNLILEGQLFGFSSSVALFEPRPGRTITYQISLSSKASVVQSGGASTGEFVQHVSDMKGEIISHIWGSS